ncbi:DUF6519 domain-containing protein [Tundrisphaera lichenicola]|uniref:DUF6519 domain-containing protein n=1 Tax=Tundrisphaera lichenicola TaxID=2029860 RepID=UPI003EC0A975
MTGDFSRLTHDPRKHYHAVLQQQGRVGLDADANEGAEILLHRLLTEATDVIGDCGRPIHAPGFRIKIVPKPGFSDAVSITQGRFYAGGMLCELDGDDPAVIQTGIADQPDWPVPDLDTWNAAFANPPIDWPGFAPQAGRVLFYLEAFPMLVSALFDEARRSDQVASFGAWVRERALGGGDTTSRLQTVARVKSFPVGAGVADCEAACKALEDARPRGTSGTLKVTLKANPPVPKPCETPQEGGYGGAEYRTYRVEIHTPGAAGTATFKWSIENAAFAVRIQVDDALRLKPVSKNTDIPVLSVGNDQVTRLAKDHWVEVCGEETELGVFRNPVARILGDPVEQPDGVWFVRLSQDFVQPTAPFLRRWSGEPRQVALSTPFTLDDGSGLSVAFGAGPAPATTYFHDQDFWIWSASPYTRQIEPAEMEGASPPRGVERHYCCLALYDWTVAGGLASAQLVEECPHDFPPLTELPEGGEACCCTFVVHDGVTSKGKFNTIAEAVKAIPKTGATLCILPGEHQVEEPIEVEQGKVIIEGCGTGSRVVAPRGAFSFKGISEVTVSGLHFTVRSGPAVRAEKVTDFLILDNIVDLFGEDPNAAFQVSGTNIEVSRNRVAGGEKSGDILNHTCLDVLPTSAFVSIRQNTFGPKVGLGVTLASPAARVEGEGAVRYVVIDGNDFGGLGAQAIAGGGGKGTSLSQLRIERNRFLSNGATDGEMSVLSEIRSDQLAPGVIELTEAAQVEILENQLEGNGPGIPMSGILVEHTRGVRVAGNSLLANGGAVDPKKAQGGIVLVNVAGVPEDPTSGPFAAAVEHNRVSATTGPALLAIQVSGSFAVSNNRFARYGGDATWGELKVLQGLTIMINNPLRSLKNRVVFRSPEYVLIDDRPEALASPFPPCDLIFQANRCELNAPDVAFADLSTSVLIENNSDTLVSDNQFQCLIGPNAGLVAHARFTGTMTRVLGNGFREEVPPPRLRWSAVGLGLMLTGVNNQATLCLYFRGYPLAAVNLNLVPIKADCPSVDSQLKPVQPPEEPPPGGTPGGLARSVLTALLKKRLARLENVIPPPKDDLNIADTSRFIDQITLMEKRLDRFPGPDKRAVSVVLVVTGADGRPLPGYKLVVEAANPDVRGRTDPATTDDLGLATALIRRDLFPALKDSDFLFFKVLDSSGKVVAQPNEGMSFQAGKAGLLTVVVER